MIIGVTGTLGSGKGVFSDFLVENGLKKLAFGDVVRKEARKRGIELTRDNLQQLGFDFREERGKGVWAKKLIARIDPSRDYVIDGFRYPDQVEIFREQYREDFSLVAIYATQMKRYERLIERDGGLSWGKFLIMDDKDQGYMQGGQNTSSCFLMAQRFIDNGSNLGVFRKEAYLLLKEFRTK